MKLEFFIVLQFVLIYSISGISIPNKYRGRAAGTTNPPNINNVPKDVKKTSDTKRPREIDVGRGDDPPSKGDIDDGFNLPQVEEPFFQTMKKHVCRSVKTMPGEAAKMNFTLDMEMSENEVYELAMTNMAHEMTSDSVLPFLPENLRWMKQVLDLLASITTMTCTGNVVPVEYINVAKNLFMYYVYKNSFQENMIDPVTGQEVKSEKPDQTTWDSIVDMLEKCNDKISSLSFTLECKVANYFMARDGSMSLIQPAEEQYDTQMGASVYGEEVIDAVWLMFSTAYGRCYALNHPQESVVLNFLENFKKEFLVPLYPRWQMLSNSYNEFFPMIMGAFDLTIAKRNLRSCTAAAYMYEGIGDRQLVRPLPITVDDETIQNFKTGRSMND